MLAVVGLGNPGREYQETRHNVGYRVVQSLARGKSFENRGEYLFLGSRIAGRKVLLVLPTTFMNRSGRAVARLLEDFRLDLSGVLVVSDDANLPRGRIRIRPRGGDGGQKGLASIVQAIGSEEFPRVRLGIGTPEDETDLADYVLLPFLEEEKEEVERMIRGAVRCVREWVTGGIDRAMERFNRKDPLGEGIGEGETTER